MPDDVKRPYRSPLREQSARRTRATIREAAAALFVERGYVSTTVKDVAAAAGVAVRTVHATFPGGKAEIFHEALDVATAGDEEPVAVMDRAEVRESLADPDRILADLARQGAALHARAGGLLRACFESAGADAEMRELDELGARMMAGNMRTVAEALHEHGLLAVPVDEAADVLFTLNSPHVHDLLVHRRGWTAARYAEWLEGSLRLLIGTRRDGAR
ncbi:TetR family transcriptional regulator [Pseudonocardia pini]|uniref:TetR family transcriptional regulator n=1 Tax=Pseudonocardia pini TaxID=2758030 RepID=UPI001C693AE1|nr:TetR family transcriptional regulator [Pseudonocardia pini]